MVKSIFIVLSFLSLISCSNKKQSSINNPVHSFEEPAIIGIWTDGQTENATFQITDDSIYYVDSNQSFAYRILGDSITIKFDGFDDAFKIERATKDSLILSMNNERSIFWRFKN
jgi:hypothetical protein